MTDWTDADLTQNKVIVDLLLRLRAAEAEIRALKDTLSNWRGHDLLGRVEKLEKWHG